jgi:hypothetical protein
MGLAMVGEVERGDKMSCKYSTGYIQQYKEMMRRDLLNGSGEDLGVNSSCYPKNCVPSVDGASVIKRA